MHEAPSGHEPVLVAALARLLGPRPGQIFLDGTVGLGGHAAAFMPLLAPNGTYIGIDLDPGMLSAARERLGDGGGVKLHLFAGNYTEFATCLEQAGIDRVDHVLLDLGINSAQLDDPQRGFSFDRDGPLDMRFDRDQTRQALDIVNGTEERELADLFYQFGQEGNSRKIARRICEARHGARIRTTKALAAIVESTFKSGGATARGKTHPATRVFQALRVAVNQELDNLRLFLERITPFVRPGGKLAVISFHSLEDGTVKQFMRAAKQDGTFIELTRRPVVVEADERDRNPRSRSAKLRVAERPRDE